MSENTTTEKLLKDSYDLAFISGGEKLLQDGYWGSKIHAILYALTEIALDETLPWPENEKERGNHSVLRDSFLQTIDDSNFMVNMITKIDIFNTILTECTSGTIATFAKEKFNIVDGINHTIEPVKRSIYEKIWNGNSKVVMTEWLDLITRD